MVYYEGIETEGEGQQLILSKLVEKYENLKAAQEEDFRLHPTKFETFVTSLSDTSFIYTVPAQYENEYAFVKICSYLSVTSRKPCWNITETYTEKQRDLSRKAGRACDSNQSYGF